MKRIVLQYIMRKCIELKAKMNGYVVCKVWEMMCVIYEDKLHIGELKQQIGEYATIKPVRYVDYSN